MSRDLRQWLKERRLLTGDGAMGTMLQEAGLKPGGCPELWNESNPEAVAAVMQAYLESGSELLETNTFGGSPTKLESYGAADRCHALNRAAAEIGRRVAGEKALVLGSMGPTGKLLDPLGPLSEDEARDSFRRQAEALAEGGADALCIETMTDVTEASLAVAAAAATGLPVLATMTFDATPRGFFTIMGVTPKRAATELAEAGACVLGCNCGTGSAQMIEMLRAFRQATDLPLLVQPNAGLPELVGGVVRYPERPELTASFVEALVEAGASIIGGCCGTTPAHLRAVAEQVGRLRA